MKEHLTEMVFILDGSGFVLELESKAIGGVNSMLEKQKKEPRDTVLLDDRGEALYGWVKLGEAGLPPIRSTVFGTGPH